MPLDNPNPIDAWLQRNLRKPDAPATASGREATANGYRLRVVRLMLGIAAMAVIAMWYEEQTLNLTNAIDTIAYPVLLTVTSLGALLLLIRPNSLQAVLITVFVTLIVYLLTDYYYILAYRMPVADASYELATVALWLPFGYVASYVFFSPQVAMRTSLAIYAAISVPQWVLLGAETNLVDRQIAIAMLISHPVYIAALWGVAQLKSHVRGVQELAKSMSVAASEDPLTGVANRRAMLHALKTVTHVLSAARRPVALLLIDVDRFKLINDNYGHSVGDEVLITLASRTGALLRTNDLLGRWGGEEFLIIALDQSEAQALQMAERLREELERTVYSLVGTVTVSIGVTLYLSGETVDAFVKRADDALYLAKKKGRNRVEGMFCATEGH